MDPKVPADYADLEAYWKQVNPRPGGRGRASWLKGELFGRLRVIDRAGTDKHGASLWLCRCSCGTEKIVSRSRLMDGRVKSCGCLAKEYKASEKPWLRGYRLPDMDDDEQEESDFDDRFAEAVDEVLDE